ncbi:hypothetical protein CEXT_354051 [Caerostris extrusa]|uniref:Uncharacterized protein n=1 Tax=Caerostris extrusa TaxID=172846 RepID=A0AAV4PUX6_CAEEX|nr:hypothetical protein CEXT_354051 [Caerostris extrusa]
MFSKSKTCFDHNFMSAPRCGGWVYGETEGRAFHHAVMGLKFEVENFSNYWATAGNSEHLSRSKVKASKRKVITALKKMDCSGCMYCKSVEIINASFLCSSGSKSDTMNAS